MISPPRTLAEARTYRYGTWRGRVSGVPYAQSRCAYDVRHIADAWDHGAQCSRLPGHGPANLYCRQHAKMLAKREAQT